MEPNQAAGYLFEIEIMDLLRESGYVEVKEEKLEGRGTKHQIDAYGIYSIPVPFTYPIRLIAEAKCYEKSIELPLIRSFLGVITDISQNYFVKRGDRGIKRRFLDTGCFFTTAPFTKPSQDFAWAHNIFLVSFHGIWHIEEIKKKIKHFLNTQEIQKAGKLSKESLIANYELWKQQDNQELITIALPHKPTMIFGILDNVYPVVLVGNEGWHKKIRIPPDTDKVKGVKLRRKKQRGSYFFEIEVKGNDENIVVFDFTIPDTIAKKLVGKIDETQSGKKVFNLNIPLNTEVGSQAVRRIITIEVHLPKEKRKKRSKKNEVANQNKVEMANNNRFRKLTLKREGFT
jgi:hypothetical protein